VASWQEFESQAPQMAAAGRKMLYQYGQPLAYLATVRKDGAPRIHPICPSIVNGSLYAFIGLSPKRRDLERDGHYALHTFPCRGVDDEFLVMGHATASRDSAVRAQVINHLVALGVKIGDGEELFEFKIDSVMHAEYAGGPGTWPPKYSVWKASRAS
jgi:hypothetical protein